MSEIQKFDPATLMQGVKDRIKSEFVSLIPDEQWTEMVKKEIDNFFAQKEAGYSSNRVYASDFGILVRNTLNEEAKKRLADYLDTPEFNTTWGNNGLPIASEAVKQMMIENSGVILQNMFGGMFSQMAMNMMSQIRNGQQY
jgi:hypothetical protein